MNKIDLNVLLIMSLFYLLRIARGIFCWLIGYRNRDVPNPFVVLLDLIIGSYSLNFAVLPLLDLPQSSAAYRLPRRRRFLAQSSVNLNSSQFPPQRWLAMKHLQVGLRCSRSRIFLFLFQSTQNTEKCLGKNVFCYCIF